MWKIIVLATLFVCYGQCQPAEKPKEPERHKIVIVGAGVSGFTAASTLLRHNVTDFIVLEASDRVGGRIHTVQFGGVDIDLGAEFIHGEKDNRVFELASPHNLLTSYTPLLEADKFLFASPDDHKYDPIQVKGLIDEAYVIVEREDMQHFNGSIADYFNPRLEEFIQSKNVDSKLAEALRHYVPLLIGLNTGDDDLTQLGAWGTYDYVDNEGDYLLKWKTGGYKTLFDIISNKFPDSGKELPVSEKIKFGKQVTRVEHKDGVGEAEVTCADGSRYLADHVLVTVSLGVLKKSAGEMFHPPLPSDNTAAIETIGFGCGEKVFMLFPTRWWPTDINIITPLFTQHELQQFKNSSKHGYWTADMPGYHPVMEHDRMLVAWFTGESCRTMESLTEDQVTEGLMELLREIVGNKYNISEPEQILRSGWANNPYTQGAYSFRTVASDQLNITNNHLAQSVMAGDKPLIMFCGEATNPYHSGTVHGALTSGRRSAHHIFDYLTKP